MVARSSGLVVAVAAGLVLPARSAPAQAPWVAESPQAVLDRFAATFTSRDVDAVAALFAPDATFFGLSLQGLAEPLRGPDGARAYFARVFAPGGPRLGLACRTEAMREPAPGLALAASVCRLGVARADGPAVQRRLRVSAALAHGQAGWRFTDLHVSASAAPQPPQPRRRRRPDQTEASVEAGSTVLQGAIRDGSRLSGAHHWRCCTGSGAAPAARDAGSAAAAEGAQEAADRQRPPRQATG